jgi:cytosine/adenosine deaminase-related metal-dependent hydrolase
MWMPGADNAARKSALATLGATTFSGLDHQYGSIEKGKAADKLSG